MCSSVCTQVYTVYFRGRKLSRILRFCGESFLRKIWGLGVLWHDKNEQSAKVFSLKASCYMAYQPEEICYVCRYLEGWLASRAVIKGLADDETQSQLHVCNLLFEGRVVWEKCLHREEPQVKHMSLCTQSPYLTKPYCIIYWHYG